MYAPNSDPVDQRISSRYPPNLQFIISLIGCCNFKSPLFCHVSCMVSGFALYCWLLEIVQMSYVLAFAHSFFYMG